MTTIQASVGAAANVTPESGPPPGDAHAWKAAQDFEAMAIGQFLQPMFATVDSSQGLFGGGTGEQTFRPMLITEMAKEIEQRGGIGLAAPVYDQMLKMQEKQG